MPLSPIGFWSEGGGTPFTPTILGDSGVLVGEVVVESLAESSDPDPQPSGADADTWIWVVFEGGDIEIRVAADFNGNLVEDSAWYNPSHVDQGAPDTNLVPGTTVFQLGETTGVTVNIFSFRANTPDGLSETKVGTFTDDDKSTFFAPSASVDYGWNYEARAVDPPGAGENNSVTDWAVRQFTFRKAGFEDYTISFGQEVDATAASE